MYEAKFIIGAIAGSLSESGELGYICDYPIYGQIAGINAFALGAQMTNPRARVFLEWSSVKGLEAAAEALTARGIHLISAQDTAQLARGRRSSFGLSEIDGEKQVLLANPVWRWDVYYEEILRRMLSKTVQAEYESSSKALNYYWGMSAGVVDLACSDTLALAGGVSANHALRDALASKAKKKGIRFCCPDFRYCTDNAAMIGSAGFYLLMNGHRDGLDLNATPYLSVV